MAATGCWVCRGLRGEGRDKELYRKMFLEGRNWNGWTEGQWQVVPERRGTRVNSSCACVVLDPRDWQTNSFAWCQWMGWELWGKHGMKVNRLLFMKRFVGQKLILNNILNLNGDQWKERSSGRLRVKGGALSQGRPVDSEHVEVSWGQCQRYHTKVDCNDQDD